MTVLQTANQPHQAFTALHQIGVDPIFIRQGRQPLAPLHQHARAFLPAADGLKRFKRLYSINGQSHRSISSAWSRASKKRSRSSESLYSARDTRIAPDKCIALSRGIAQ